MTLLCIPIIVQDVPSALRDAAAAKDAGADLVEFRLDEFFNGAQQIASGQGTPTEADAIVRLVSDSPLPCIATCRPVSEGGGYDGDDAPRIALFERLGTAFGSRESPPRYLDVELSTMDRSANLRQKVRLALDHPEQLRDLRTSLILSLHDFSGRPPDLTRRLLRMRQEPAAAVLKVAYRARSIRDNLELLDLLADRDRPMIALAMGEFSLMSRVLAPKFGGFLSFATLRPQEVTAPGQPTIHDLLDLYRFRSIGPSTGVYGVVGWPLEHSLSPHVHNAGFEAVGHDGVYLPLPIPGDDVAFKATVLEMLAHPCLDLRGLSVTAPHKEHLVRLARESGWTIDEASARIGAANTLHAERGGSGAPTSVYVFNTDAAAVLEALAPALGDLRGARVVVLGAGGMARAAAYACAHAGATVTVVNRTIAHAEALSEALRGLDGTVSVGSMSSVERGDWQALIHCTPLGMKGGPGQDQSPLPPEALGNSPKAAVVLDTVYNPARTPLLAAAHEAGLRTIDGVAVFVAQAAAQFRRWTGRPAPEGLFRRILQESLGTL